MTVEQIANQLNITKSPLPAIGPIMITKSLFFSEIDETFAISVYKPKNSLPAVYVWKKTFKKGRNFYGIVREEGSIKDSLRTAGSLKLGDNDLVSRVNKLIKQ